MNRVRRRPGFGTACGCLAGLLLGFYAVRMTSFHAPIRETRKPKFGVSLRDFPYPYRAGLAICSDIDNTQTAEEFLAIQEFLNTEKETRWGRGVGLEIGNSYYPTDRPERQEFSYFSTNPEDRAVLRRFIHAGFVDCIHSFGEGCDDRKRALETLAKLDEDGVRSTVWINHSQAPTNLAAWFPTNLGDDVDSGVYHADATLSRGIRFVWTGAITAVVGQDDFVNPFHPSRYMDPSRPGTYLMPVMKTLAKHILGVTGFRFKRLGFHADNALVRPRRLDDGQVVYEFIRLETHPRGTRFGATASGLATNLSERVLEALEASGGYAVVYAHLGKNDTLDTFLPEGAVRGLRNLRRYADAGKLFVTTTSRLLQYHWAHGHLSWEAVDRGDSLFIQIGRFNDPLFGCPGACEEALRGITFYVPDGKPVSVMAMGRECRTVRNPPDLTGRPSVSVAWKPLVYPG